jgi:hypothetical protein
MRLVYREEDQHWVILHGGQPVAIGGTTFFASREAVEAEISKRGLVVAEDGSLIRADQVPVLPTQNAAPVVEHDTAPQVAQEAPEPVVEAPTVAEVIEDSLADLIGPLDPQEPSTAVDKPKKAKKAAAPTTRAEAAEAAKAKRREQNRRYYLRRKEREAEKVKEKHREWWESNPEKVRTYRERYNERRRQRYANDPEYRAKVAAANRRYQTARRTEEAPEE